MTIKHAKKSRLNIQIANDTRRRMYCCYLLTEESLVLCVREREPRKHITVYCAVLPNTKKLSLPNKVFLMCHRRKDCWTIVSSAKEDFFFFIFHSFYFFFISRLLTWAGLTPASKCVYTLISARVYIESYGNSASFWFIVRYTSL